ncbi:MAG: helix-turn-helix domain-containing protein, partial [Pseudomonadota bacterium]
MKRLLVLCALAVGASFAPVFGPASARAADLACPDKLQFATASAADVLTTQEAAAFLKIPATNLVEAAAAGLIPARNVLGEWRFLRPALVAWLSGIDAPQDCFSMPAPDLRDLEARAPTQVLPAPGVRPAPEVHPAPGVRPAPGVVPGPDLALRPEDLARIDG